MDMDDLFDFAIAMVAITLLLAATGAGIGFAIRIARWVSGV